MDKYELLNDFIDGELEPSLENYLFLELSSNEELRQKLKNIMALKLTLTKNRSAFAPSLDQSSRLFDKLGFINVFELENKQNLAKNKFINFSRPLIFLFLGAIIMFFLYPYLIEQEPQIIENSANSRHIYDLINQIPPIPVIKEQVDGNDKIRGFVSDKSSRLDDSKSFFVIQETDKNLLEDIKQFSFDKDKDISESIYLIDNIKLITLNPQLQSLVAVSPIVHRETKFSIEVIYSQPFYTSEPSISPKKNALFNNNIAKLFYNASDDLAFGIEVRQENFYQVFEGMDEYGIINTYRQQPNFTTFGTFARYKLMNLGSISPYIEINIGANNAGWVYRGNTGIIFSPYTNFNLILSLEYSNFRFVHQENWFNSDKFGINYGIGIKF